MKKELKKAAAVMLATAMTSGMLAGCGNSVESAQKNQGGESSTSAGESNESAGKSYADYSGGFEETVTIQIPIYDRAFANWNVTDNYYTRWIQQEFGKKYNVNVEFVAISKSNQTSDYMQLLAAGSAPDIIIQYDMPKQLAYFDEGAFQPLDLEEIAYYAPTYWENMQDVVKNYGAIDGEYYFFFADRPGNVDNIPLIRQDWLDAVGMDMPQSLEELYAVLEAWKEAGLGNGGGLLEQNAIHMYMAFRDWPVDDHDQVLYSDVSVAPLPFDAMHDYLKSLNYRYNNGLIDKEFYLNIDETAIQQDFISGASGILWRWAMAGSSTLFESLKKNNPDAEVAVLPQAALTPEGNKPQKQGNQRFGLIQGINQDTTDEERVAIWMYLEWMSQKENLMYLQNGIEGETYTINEKGLPMKITDYDGEAKLSENNNKDYWCMVTENVKYDDLETEKAAAMLNNIPEGYSYLVEQAYEEYESRKEYVNRDPLFTTVISSISEYQADLNEKWKELHVKCVMASEDEFEDTYKKACEEYLNAGYQKILDEKQAAFDNGKYILGN